MTDGIGMLCFLGIFSLLFHRLLYGSIGLFPDYIQTYLDCIVDILYAETA